MTQYIMRLLGNEHLGEALQQKTWLQSYEPSTRDGRGLITGTRIRENALRGTMAELTELWGAQSATRPTRDDGRPNKPLTAFSVMFEEAGDE
jgi:hypothetical protein